MRMLVAASLVKSYRGVVGGFSLVKPAEEITLYDVIVAMEGPLNIHRCLSDLQACNRGFGQECSVHQAMTAIQERLAADLSTVSFAALAARTK
jgi:Rrf2 family protein